jgi:hypothetical protein
MKGKFNFKLGALCAILSAMLVLPALGQAEGKGGAIYKEKRDQLIKELKLAPEKEKAILAVEDKYARERKEIVDGVKKANVDLQAALAAATPDEAKLKELVSALTAGQDKMFATFKNQRDEELALMTPAEQAKYLLTLGQWRQKMMDKRDKSRRGEEIIQTNRLSSERPVKFSPALGLPSRPRAPKAITVYITPGEAANKADARELPGA